MFFTKTTKMSSKFRKIKTADELEKAILYLKAEQKALETGIGNDVNILAESLKPANLIRTIIPPTTLADTGLSVVRALKKLFAKKPAEEPEEQ